MTHAPWWRTAVIYQIYLRSFADGNGDGVGDLAGVRSRLDYLARLGVDALWFTPWYPSPMHDGGYDVADYCDIDPAFGTLEDARTLIEQAHERDIRIIIDIVPNHTSHEHPWFRAALDSAPGSPERRLYHFRDGVGSSGDQPPNDWISAFGGSAWTRVTSSDGRPEQWYLHLFAPEQPDLNWEHPEVRSYFEKVISFWFDLGVDGLRVDAAPGLMKVPGLPDHGFAPGDRFDAITWEASPLWDVDAVHEIFRSWRAIADSYPGDRMFVGEVPVKGPQRLANYVRPDEFHTAFNLEFIKAPWNADSLHANIDGTLNALRHVGAPATWVLSNHDETRHLTRYGRADAGVSRRHTGAEENFDLALGTRRARAAILLMLALPGSAYLYQGEELGLWEVEDLPDDVRRDPVWQRTGGAEPGRDGCRVPLPWSGQLPPYGFNSGSAQPWLPQPDAWADYSAAAEDGEPGSMLTLYRTATDLRRKLSPAAADAFGWQPAAPGVLAWGRGDQWTCVANIEGDPLQLTGDVILASVPLQGQLLPANTTAWITSPK
jgi:alpha-glucosidase